MNDQHAHQGIPNQVRHTIGTRLRTERARPDRIRLARNAGWFAVGTVCFGAFMGQLDASIVAITFPAMQREFSASVAAVQ